MNSLRKINWTGRTKRLAVCVACVALLTAGIVSWRWWARQLNAEERRLLGRWSYRPEADNFKLRFIEFRDDRIALIHTPERFVGYEDWDVVGDTLTLNEYQYRVYGEPSFQRGWRTVARTFNDLRFTDRSQSHKLIWLGADEFELRWKSDGNNENYVLRMQRVVDESGRNH